MTHQKTDHLLLLELFSDVSWTTARNFNPGFGEKGTSGHDESHVKYRMYGIKEGFLDG